MPGPPSPAVFSHSGSQLHKLVNQSPNQWLSEVVTVQLNPMHDTYELIEDCFEASKTISQHHI